MPGIKPVFETDPQKPLIGSLSRVVEHPQKAFVSFWLFVVMSSLIVPSNLPTNQAVVIQQLSIG